MEEKKITTEANIEHSRFKANHNKFSKHGGSIFSVLEDNGEPIKEATFTTKDSREYIVKNGTIRRVRRTTK